MLGRLHFEADGLILAEDDVAVELVGFVHAGVRPRVDRPAPRTGSTATLGTVAMLVVDPDRR